MEQRNQPVTDFLAVERRELLEALLAEQELSHDEAEPPSPARPEQIPLSYAQERLWFLEQFEPQTGMYNIPVGLRLQGRLEASAMELALNEIIARHEALRTTFHMEGGVPVQRVQPAPRLVLDVEVVEGATTKEREEVALRRLEEASGQSFDLQRAPLIRARLLRLSADEHVLLLAIHHIVSDWWSVGILMHELIELYKTFRFGLPSPLPDLTFQYADYACWQRQELARPATRDQLAYWKRMLAGPLPILELPSDRPRSAVMDAAGAQQVAILSKARSEDLKRFCRAERITPFVFLLAVFQILLSRYTSLTDIVVGTPVAGRNRADVEGLIGLFLNTVVLRSDLAGDPTFQELLHRVRKVVLDSFSNQDVPFEKLVSELQPVRDTGRSPLFQVLFNLKTGALKAVELPELAVTPVPLATGTAKFDLNLEIIEKPFGYSFCIEYRTALFDASTIDRMLEHYRNLVESALANPHQAISAVNMLSPDEEHRIVRDWNATSQPIPAGTVREAFAAQVQNAPDRTAIRFAGQKVSYRELDEWSNRVAHQLRSLGAHHESKIGVCLERGAAMVAALLGVWKAGGAYVPLDPMFPRQRLEFMAEDAALDVLITTKDLREIVGGYRGSVLDMDEPLAGGTAPLPIEGSAQDLAYVLYTSGSTGQPKGVMIEHEALMNFLASMRAEPGLTADDRLLAVTTLSFDIAGLELWLPLTTGACVVIAPREAVADGAALMKLLDEERVTVLQATPATWRLLVESGWAGSQQLKILCGGEAMTPELADALLERGESVWNLYGPTETTIWSMIEKVEPGFTRPVLVGRPIANTGIYVLDSRQRPAPVGVVGEIFIGGRGLARGYWKRDELTAEKFVPHPFVPGEKLYRTGDLGRFRAGGRLEFLGRADHQVKVRGYRIELGEIETLLRQLDGVKEAVVVARGETLAAYLEGEAAGIAPTAGIRASLKEKLPAYMVPSSFTILERLPLTPNGKVDRRALPAPAADESVSTGRTAPKDELEQQLQAIWSGILGIENVSVTASFFDLGGHSLLAVRLIAQIEKVIGFNLPLATLFHAPTIEGLANVIRERDWSRSWATLVELNRADDSTPFFCIHSLGANLVSYRKLASLLGDTRPFYGLQPFGLDGVTPPHSRMEDMARDYIAQIRKVQPHGPYALGGVCLGGVVAYEIAQQLMAEGEEVALLAIVDSGVPGRMPFLAYRPGAVFWADWHIGEVLRRSPADGLGYMAQKAGNARRRVTHAVRAKFGTPETEASLDRAIRLVRQENLKALLNYTPKPYPGKVTLFWCSETPIRAYEDTRLGWGDLALGGMEVHVVPGDHMTMVEEPHVRVMANKLRTCLDRTLPQLKETAHQ